MAKLSVKAFARAAKADEKRTLDAQTKKEGIVSGDSFVNFAMKMGVGADNALTSVTYGFNPISRNHTLLEWIHRGSWLGGVAVDLIADDMTRAGVEFTSEMEPSDSEEIEQLVTTMGIWNQVNQCIKWGRLYGGSLAVHLIDGQDPKTPLRLETVGKDQYKGLAVLDRWMVQPSLGDLVTDYGPALGLPKYYTVQDNAPVLRNQTVHYSRVAIRHVGIQLPYQQALMENLWGISILERLYDRMIAFDSASTGAAQLVYKSHLRTMSIDGLRDIVAAGGAPLEGLMQYMQIMRRFQGIEGITMLDAKDKFEVQQASSVFSGLNDALMAFAQQISGALQIPLVRLFGQSPGGLNSAGESEHRTYYDGIRQKQRMDLGTGINQTYKLVSQSAGKTLPKNFAVDFRSLWQLDEVQKAAVAAQVEGAVSDAMDKGIIGQQTAMKELRQSGKNTGIFTNITTEQIDAASDEALPPSEELSASQEFESTEADKAREHSSQETEASRQHASEEADKGRQHQAELAKAADKTKAKNGQQRSQDHLARFPRRRIAL